MIRKIIFLIGYVLVGACVGFTLVALLGLPAWISILVGIVGVRVMDRVGLGFGVQFFARRDRPGGARPTSAPIEPPASALD